MEAAARFLELLQAGATRQDLDLVLADLEAARGASQQPDDAREQHAMAVRVQEQMERQRSREAELSALYETARDLTAIRELDIILSAIVRRARQLLYADMTYLSLNDEQEGASYMKVTDGALTPEFRTLRLPLGTGLLGLVAQSGAPYFTEDYRADHRFVHRDYIDTAVDGEQIRAILGVPLIVEGQVIGALLAVHRVVRPFPASEVALLTSFAAHAAVALENARLFDEARSAVAAADRASKELRTRSEATELAASAHDLLTDVLLHSGSVVEVAAVLAQVLGGTLEVYDDQLRPLTETQAVAPATALTGELDDAITRARSSGRCVRTPDGAWIAVAAAGEEHLGTLVLHPSASMDLPQRRTLERGALVTALVLLFRRTEADAEARVRGELLADLVGGRDVDPQRLHERARRQGADLDGLDVVVVARPTGRESPEQAARVVATLGRELQGLGGSHDGVAVLLATGEPWRLGELVQERLGGATVGVVASGGGAERLLDGWQEARQTLTTLLRLGRVGEVSDSAGLGVARLLLGHNGEPELEEFVQRTLGPVLAYDRERGTGLAETMAAWLGAGGSLRSTAHALHIHANTVTQRLDRVNLLLGPGWRAGSRRLEVHLALQLVRLRR